MASRRAPRGLRTSKFIEKSMKIKDFHKIPCWSLARFQDLSERAPGARGASKWASKTAPRSSRRLPKLPKRLPGGPKMPPGALQEASSTLPRGPKRPQQAPRRLQEAPRCAKTPPGGSPRPPKTSQSPPTGIQKSSKLSPAGFQPGAGGRRALAP